MRTIGAVCGMTVAVAIAGCGGGDTTDEQRRVGRALGVQATPTPLPGPRARVEGRWRLTARPEDPTLPVEHVVWRVRPACRSGPCGAKIRSSSGSEPRLREARSGGDYTTHAVSFTHCVDEDDHIITRWAFKVVTDTTLTVTERSGDRATELTGSSTVHASRTADADPACRGGTDHYDVKVVRLDR